MADAQTQLRILLVDDDDVDRMAVRRALRHVPAVSQVTEAADADAAMTVLQQGGIDCVILDFRLPGRDGAWVLQEAHAVHIDVPFVMLTGQGDEQTAVNLMKSGAADYISKAALSPERLAQSIRHAVRVHRAEREAARANLALADNERRLRIALEATALGTWEFTPDSGDLEWDSRCKALFGLSPDATVTYEVFLQGVHPDDREEVHGQVLASLDPEGTGAFDAVYRTVGIADGIERWVRAVGRTSFADNRAVRFTGTIQDVTERKRFEEQSRRQAEFEQQLVGIVSHDLRNPISAMMMSAAALLRRQDPSGPIAKSLTRIMSSGERVTRMIRDLLDFTQARVGGGIPIQRQPCDVHALARQTIDEVQLTFADRQVVVESHGNGDGQWDPDRLAQIITNLVTNALTYSPEGTPVRVTTHGSDDGVCLTVHNHGEPIPAAVRPSLFQPFKRGNERPRDAHRSIGLGLFIVEQLVLAHGGTIEVSSEAVHGTRFIVSLPRQPSAMPDRAELRGGLSRHSGATPGQSAPASP